MGPQSTKLMNENGKILETAEQVITTNRNRLGLYFSLSD